MPETLTIAVNASMNIPLLVAQLDRNGGATPCWTNTSTHGNGVGLSLGWVTGGVVAPYPVRGGSSAEPVEP